MSKLIFEGIKIMFSFFLRNKRESGGDDDMEITELDLLDL